MAVQLEPRVLWVVLLEVDWVVQSMVVQLELAFFRVPGLFYIDTFLFLCHLMHPIHVHIWMLM